jgi:hypothetical protein
MVERLHPVLRASESDASHGREADYQNNTGAIIRQEFFSFFCQLAVSFF